MDETIDLTTSIQNYRNIPEGKYWIPYCERGDSVEYNALKYEFDTAEEAKAFADRLPREAGKFPDVRYKSTREDMKKAARWEQKTDWMRDHAREVYELITLAATGANVQDAALAMWHAINNELRGE